MKVIFFSVIALSAALLLAQSTEPSADERAIRSAILDFVEGCYAGNVERVARAFHPNLDKGGFGILRDGQIRHGTHSYDEIVEECRTLYTERLTLPESPRSDITIYEVLTHTASAKVEVEWGIDYFHLSKVDGVWRIKNSLGQSYPPDWAAEKIR